MKKLMKLFPVLLITTSFVSFTACSDIEPLSVIDSRLEHYVDIYKTEAALRNVNDRLDQPVSLTIGDLPEGWRGAGRTGEIILSKEIYDQGDSLLIEAVIFHELGHALWGFKHGDNILMSKSVPDGWLYEKYRTEILDEFFDAHDQGGNI